MKVEGATGWEGMTEFTPEEKVALKDFWQTYEAAFESVQAATQAAASRDPNLRAVLAQETVRGTDTARSRQLLQRALLEGEWSGYLESVSEIGRRYARAGLPLHSWFNLVAVTRKELLARLFGDYVKDPKRLQGCIWIMNRFLLDITLSAIVDQYLETRESVIHQQQLAIRELSTPVLPLRPGLLILPLIGVIDTDRARQLTELLLEGIRRYRAQVVVIDLTGVPAVDSAVANHLLQTVQAAKLLGASSVVTGISTENALTLTRIGVDLRGLTTTADLQSGIEQADRQLELGRPRKPSAGSEIAGLRTEAAD